MRFLFVVLCILGLVCQVDAATAQQTKLALEKMKVLSAQTVTAILGVPLHEQTFENTLGAWNQLSSQLYKQLNEFYESTKLEKLKDSKMASWALAELQNMSVSIASNENLTTLLLNASQRVLDGEHTPMQDYIAQSYIKNKGAKYVNFSLTKVDEARVSSNKKLSFLSLPGSQKTLPIDADILCIQEIFPDDADEVCHKLFGKSYDHIIYFRPNNVRLDMSSQPQCGGMLIASKYPLEQIEVNDDYLDMLVKDDEGLLGHLYVVQCARDNVDVRLKLEHVITAMQDEGMQLGTAPAILCADFNQLRRSSEANALMSTYFAVDTNSAQFLCQASKPTYAMIARDPLAHKSSRDRRRDDPHDNRDYSSRGWSGNNDHQYCSSKNDYKNNDKVISNNKKERSNEIKIAKNDSKEPKNDTQKTANMSLEANVDGSGSASASIGMTKSMESGGSLTASASGSVDRNAEGRLSGGVKFEIGSTW